MKKYCAGCGKEVPEGVDKWRCPSCGSTKITTLPFEPWSADKIARACRHAVEAIIAIFLFILQPVPALGVFFGLSLLLSYPDFWGLWVNLLFFSKILILGRIITVVGFIIFLIACVQLLRGNGKPITTGLYSMVRHPQYFGILILTLGITVMCVQWGMYWNAVEALRIWLIQVSGYIMLARYEEQHLIKEYEKEYQRYKQKVSFIFPVPCPSKIPEPCFSIILALIVVSLCVLPIL